MLAYERHGCGEPLVLVHGAAHRRQAWYPVLDRVAAEREVILVDLPGHGDSPDLELNGQPVEEALRIEFVAFLGALGLERPHVGGNSLGGRVALEAAALGHARSATALSPGGFWRSGRELGYTQKIFDIGAGFVRHAGRRSDLLAKTPAGRRLIYAMLSAHPNRVPADVALADLRGFRRAQEALHSVLSQATAFTGTIPVGVPVTIAWSARDLVLPIWQADVAKAQLPQATHLVIDSAGHSPMWDQPKRCAEILLAGSAPVATVEPLRPVTRRRPPRRNSSPGEALG